MGGAESEAILCEDGGEPNRDAGVEERNTDQ